MFKGFGSNVGRLAKNGTERIRQARYGPAMTTTIGVIGMAECVFTPGVEMSSFHAHYRRVRKVKMVGPIPVGEAAPCCEMLGCDGKPFHRMLWTNWEGLRVAVTDHEREMIELWDEQPEVTEETSA